MTDWYEIVSYLICGAMMVMMAIGISFSAFMPALDRWNRRYFITLFSVLMMYVIVLFIDVVLYTHPKIALDPKTIIIIEYLSFSVMMPMPMPFLLHCCGEKQKGNALLRSVVSLWVIFCLMLFSSQFTNAFYYSGPDGQYVRGTLFPLLISPLAMIMTLNLHSLIKKRRQLSKRIFTALLIYLLPTAVMLITYLFVAVDTLVSFWIGLCAMTMFALILTDNVEKYMRQQREIANQRAGIMVLQMRPHFIYNTMMTIYYLCKQDADKAQQVTLDFTTYLRQNFTAIASEDTIPFSEELKHTQAYLAVEQAQHEDNLFVSFDTPHTMFRLPPLALQPLVENAVKHGMDPNGEPLNISVKTRQTKGGSEIIVEDSGPGYDPADDNEPHIALNSIRERLKTMCGGSLEITPRESGGTRVTIHIPMKRTKEQ